MRSVKIPDCESCERYQAGATSAGTYTQLQFIWNQKRAETAALTEIFENRCVRIFADRQVRRQWREILRQFLWYC